MFHFASPYHSEPAYPGYGYARPRHTAASLYDDEELRYAQALENRRRRAAMLAAEERERREEAQYAHALNYRRRQAELAAAQQDEEYEEEMARREQKQQELRTQREAALVAQEKRAQEAKSKKVNKAATTITGFLKRALAKQAASHILSGLKQIRTLRAALAADVAAYTTALTEDPPRTEKQAYMQLLQQQDRLERSLLKTDSITTHGDPFLRAQRKAIVAEIQHALTRLDADVDASSSGSRSSSVSPARAEQQQQQQQQQHAEEEEEEAVALATFFSNELTARPAPDEVDIEGEALELFFEALATLEPSTASISNHPTATLADAKDSKATPLATPTATAPARISCADFAVTDNGKVLSANLLPSTVPTSFADTKAQFTALTRFYHDAVANLNASIATLPVAQTPEQQAERDTLQATLLRVRNALPTTTTEQ